MKTYKKVLAGLLVLPFLLSLFSVLLPFLAKDASANHGMGFLRSEIQLAEDNSGFYFPGGSAQTISVVINRAGTPHTINFTTTQSLQQNGTYAYTHGGGLFCTPPTNLVQPPDQPNSQIMVRIISLSPLQASIVESATGPFGSGNSHIWPGLTTQDCGGLNNNPRVPNRISQASVTPRGSGGGAGDEYTEAEVRGASLTFFDNGGKIRVTFPSAPAVVFSDREPYDRDYNFQSDEVFCSTSTQPSRGQVDIPDNANLAVAPINNVTLNINFYRGPECVPNVNITSKSVVNPPSGPGRLAQAVLRWNVSVLQALTCDPDSGNCSSAFEMTAQPSNNRTYLQLPSSGCGGYQAILTGPPETTRTAALTNRGIDPPCGTGSRQVVILGDYGQPPEGDCDPDTDPTCPPSGGADSDTSDCVLNNSTLFEWVLCPITTGIGKATDGLNAMVEDLLEIDVDETFPKTGDGNGVYKAWTIIKNLSTVLVIILMLVMVISQAIGSGVFEGYTVRKVLPKLVIAVIAIQLSWELCIWLIKLANDLGNGIKEIMIYPFDPSGGGAMDLDNLINRVDWEFALAANATLVVLLVALASVISGFLWFIALVAFILLMAVVIALAMLMLRNVLVIACVMLVPLAIIMWVLPGTERYWRMWKDNFIKLLLLFPLMIIIIYAGRIAAWIAGDLGRSGWIDALFVLLAFFAPYFLIFKAFKWGGGALALAYGAIQQSKMLAKGREFGINQLKIADKRRRGRLSEYDPNEKPYGVRSGVIPNKKFVPSFLRGKRTFFPMMTGRVMPRIYSGHVLPTDRSRALTALEYENYKKETDAEQDAYNNAVYQSAEKGNFEGGVFGYDSSTGGWRWRQYKKGDKGPGPAKAALENMMLHPNSRQRNVNMKRYIDTSSWIELENDAVLLDPSSGSRKERKYKKELLSQLRETYGDHMFGEGGAMQFRDEEGNAVAGKFVMRPFQHPDWIGVQDNNPPYWSAVGGKRADLNPPVAGSTYPKYYSEAEAAADSEKAALRQQGVGRIINNPNWGLLDQNGDVDEAKWQKYGGLRLSDADRTSLSMSDNYVSNSNVGGQAQGFIQEVTRSQNAFTSAQFARVLEATARGGPNGADRLVNMAGGEGSDLMKELDKALGHIKDVNGNSITYMQYVNAARDNNMNALPQIDLNAVAAAAGAAAGAAGGIVGGSSGAAGGGGGTAGTATATSPAPGGTGGGGGGSTGGGTTGGGTGTGGGGTTGGGTGGGGGGGTPAAGPATGPMVGAGAYGIGPASAAPAAGTGGLGLQPQDVDVLAGAVERAVVRANKKSKPTVVTDSEGNVTLNIQHGGSGWSTGAELPPEPTNQALRPPPPTAPPPRSYPGVEPEDFGPGGKYPPPDLTPPRGP